MAPKEEEAVGHAGSDIGKGGVPHSSVVFSAHVNIIRRIYAFVGYGEIVCAH